LQDLLRLDLVALFVHYDVSMFANDDQTSLDQTFAVEISAQLLPRPLCTSHDSPKQTWKNFVHRNRAQLPIIQSLEELHVLIHEYICFLPTSFLEIRDFTVDIFLHNRH